MKSRPAPLIPPRLRAFLVRVPLLVPAVRLVRRVLAHERNLLLALVAATLAIGVAAAQVSADWFSPSLLVLVTLTGGLQLRLRSLIVLLGAVAAVLVYLAAMRAGHVGPGLLATIAVTGTLAALMARTRGKIGVQGLRGDAMLLELRDRLRAQSDLPPLPAKDWGGRVVLKQAGGSSFGGDFVVSMRDGDRLELAVVDVSGKGVDAGTRALLLSGTFGGLLGSVERFLPACNSFLHRQRPGEGFVTAVHLSLDLSTGEYTITSAGHPPVVKFDAGTGTWRVSTAKGVVLGVVPDLNCEPDSGVLRKGDALMLFTDGLIEQPGRDIDAGLDRLLGEAERVFHSGVWHEGAKRLVTAMSSGHNDDCALVLIWRP